MNSKKKPIPLEVSAWMDKGLTLRKITANSRLLTNDTRQNIVLSRQFFSNLLTLSYSRYRKMAEYDFDKKLFLKNQVNKAETSMPGFRSTLDQLTSGMNRSTSVQMMMNRRKRNPLQCQSTQSFLSRSDTKTDSQITRTTQQPSPQPTSNESEVMPIIISPTPSRLRTSSRLKMSRERLERLAQPKGFRPKSTNTHVRAHLIEDTVTTPEDIFGKIDHASEVEVMPIHQILPDKPKSAVNDNRFRTLVEVFSHVHEAKKSNVQTVKSIVQANPSLQDEYGQWRVGARSAISRKAELDRSRQQLAEKLNSRLDVFLIDCGA